MQSFRKSWHKSDLNAITAYTTPEYVAKIIRGRCIPPFLVWNPKLNAHFRLAGSDYASGALYLSFPVHFATPRIFPNNDNRSTVEVPRDLFCYSILRQ
jgi:hypothetical protein